MISAGHRLLEQADGAEILYNGVKYAALSSDIKKTRGDRRGGGQFPEIAGSVSVRRYLTKGVEFVQGSRITVDGAEYYVGEVASDSSTYTIQLETRNRK